MPDYSLSPQPLYRKGRGTLAPLLPSLVRERGRGTA